jgi:hypothetical protein
MGEATGRARRAGRHWKQWTPEQAEAALREWRASGLTAEQFAASKGVSAQRLQYWKRCVRGDAEPSSGKLVPRTPSAFVSVAVPARAVSLALGPEIVIETGQLRLRVRETIDGDRLEGVVRAIERAMRRC